MFKKNIFLIILIIAIVSVFFIKQNFFKSNFKTESDINKIQYVKIAGKIIKVDLAVTAEEQKNGLSGRKELKENEGMLFVFNYINKHSFWMKDMNFPIDIIWIGDDLRVVFIKENALPESYPEAFIPDQDARYVLEVFPSFSEKNNLKVGQKVEFLSS